MLTAFPETPVLTQKLSTLFGKHNEGVELLNREPFQDYSTFPVEIFTCRKEDGTIFQLFGKYLAGKGPNNFGHRGGVEYEAAVYAQLLSQTNLPTTTCYGKCHFAEAGETLLVLDFLGD